jgi:hypothetical protein
MSLLLNVNMLSAVVLFALPQIVDLPKNLPETNTLAYFRQGVGNKEQKSFITFSPAFLRGHHSEVVEELDK